jgi:hypothetical protein
MSQILPSGTLAPGFALHVTPDQTVSLSEFRGRPVILASTPPIGVLFARDPFVRDDIPSIPRVRSQVFLCP